MMESKTHEVGGSGGLATSGEPLTAKFAALLFRGASPDTRVLIGGQGEVKARLTNVTVGAHRLRVLNLLNGGTSGTDREEEIGIGVSTCGLVTPVVGARAQGH